MQFRNTLAPLYVTHRRMLLFSNFQYPALRSATVETVPSFISERHCRMLFSRVRIRGFFQGVRGIQPVLGSVVSCSKAVKISYCGWKNDRYTYLGDTGSLVPTRCPVAPRSHYQMGYGGSQMWHLDS